MIEQKLFSGNAAEAGVTNQHPTISTNYSQPPPPPPPPSSTTTENHLLRCPRCDSSNTKFCYYNNYNLTQPRYFCKTCRRYWTRGGALRNVPIGGGCRKYKGITIAAALAKQISSTGKLRQLYSSEIGKSDFIINSLEHSKPILWAGSPQSSHLFSLLRSTQNPNPNPNPNPVFTSNTNRFNPFWRNSEMVQDQKDNGGIITSGYEGRNTGNNPDQMHQQLRSSPSNYYHHDQAAAPVTNPSSSASASTVANGEPGSWNLMIPWSDLSITNSAYP